jgi:hypothetical protein
MHARSVARCYIGAAMSKSAALAQTLTAMPEGVVLDDTLLDSALREAGADLGAGELLASAPHLFARASVFVDHTGAEAMRAVVRAVENVVALPAYRALALAHAAPMARLAVPQRGAFLGFDFHLGGQGPQLIEINTNAGGGLLNAVLRRAQRRCCSEVGAWLVPEPTSADEAFVAMLREEFALARGAGTPLRTLAIVDDAPEGQYLYPEFKLFARLFERHGIATRVVDASALTVREGRLWEGEFAIDLVYNRCTDFTFDDPRHAALAIAHAEGLAVITPHPQAHALYADKRRLCTLSDPARLAELGASAEDLAILARHVPRTVEVHAADRERLWAERKSLFFKPSAGYGSKAAYRGDKLTRRVFEEQILVAPYVAQALVPPSSRVVRLVDGTSERTLKLDVRNFAYHGAVQLVCARLYEGQTTNFRTQGGGFAPVFETVR